RVEAALERVLALPDPPTALLTGNGRITITVLRALASRAAPRPALVGFDDFELADLIVPGVTVIAQDAAGLGRVAAERLFHRLSGGKDPATLIRLPTRLIPRGSGEIPPP